MSVLAPASIDLAKYTLATPHAHEIKPGDVIGVSGDWCAVLTYPVGDQPVNPMWVELEVAPLDRPECPRPWQLLHDSRMAVLREGGRR